MEGKSGPVGPTLMWAWGDRPALPFPYQWRCWILSALLNGGVIGAGGPDAK